MYRNQCVLQTLIFCTAILTITSCTRTTNAQSELVMGTICSINLYKDGSKENYRKLFARLKEIEDIFSANNDTSVMSLVNNNAGVNPQNVPAEFIDVLTRALYFAEISDGAFDPTIGTVVKLWNIGTEDEVLPPIDKIQNALRLVNWRDVIIDAEQQSVFLKQQGMKLDLGGIVKGYAADELVRIIKELKIKCALIDLGGNIYVHGKKNRTSVWKIGVQDPANKRGTYVGYVEVESGTLVTSGVYERYFEQDGIRYHHILSTQTGYPVESGLDSVTIINTDALYPTDPNDAHGMAHPSMDADALSTTLFALGYDKACILLKNFPNTGAIFILHDGTIRQWGDSVNFKKM
ncbi:MAG: FAD:protein FMN transferase [Termitinemataceae bacterium]|nr:MAG: FAD:protein FMN transferase [Termitinemataceae bacterium]